MSIIAVLGTGFSEEEVCEIMHILGFGDYVHDECTEARGVFDHSSVQSLRIQVHHTLSYLNGVEGVITEIEFEARNASPTNEMFDVLKDVYRKMPDLVYCTAYAIIQKKTPVNPLSHFFENLQH